MITSILSFLGGSAFRMIWGELAAWVTKKQDHQFEVERMRIGAELDAAAHARNIEAIRVQAELGVKTIQVQAEADLERIDADTFGEGVRRVGRQTGLRLIDGWNAAITPAVATWSVVMLTLAEIGAFIMSENTAAVCFAALGLYLADRRLAKRGK